IYAGTDDGNGWVSTNNGSNWTNVSALLPDLWVTRVTCDPFDVMKAYVTFSGYRFDDDMVHVYMTADGGQSWLSIAGNLPDIPSSDIIPDPDLSSTFYVATDVGVFYTSDGGASWNLLGTGLPLAPVTDLTFYDSTRTLIAGTYGRSMYSLDLSELAVSVHPTENFASGFNVYPVPFNDFFYVDFSSATD